MAEHIYAEQVLSSKRYGDGVVESVVRPCGERREEVELAPGEEQFCPMCGAKVVENA